MGDEEGGEKKMLKIGPSEIVKKFDLFYAEYNGVWATRDERLNPDQGYDKVMLRNEIMPQIEKDYKASVDIMIKSELENLRAISGSKGKKKKKGKKAKKKKIKLYGAKYIKDMSEYEMLVDLVKHGIVKKLPATALSEFVGEFNYIHLMIDDIKETPREPSMALI